ncbi:MAG: branched-chain amino acid ABC transporter ATP-binding protein/permease, partial [Hyphomicrobiales bacterium]|nr:branched-chain amino acid ABC transporter ATP-binding protein/permease [Hyphomicrobiales bacterium]
INRWRAFQPNRGSGAAGMMVPAASSIIGFILFAAAGLCPLFLSEFKVGLIGLGLTYGLFAIGLDLAWGRTGIVSIGQAVFFGLGTYGVAIALVRHGSAPFGAAIGIALAGILGAFIAAVGLRRVSNPSTMAVLTLATTLLAEKVARDWWSLTNGSSGLYVPPLTSTYFYYYVCFVATTGVVGLLWFFVLRRPLGNRLTAVRLNDRRAEHLGIPIFRERVVAFTLSAMVSAIAGCLSAPWMSSVSPDRVGILLSTQVLVWVAVGGRATLLGPFVGAVALTYGQDVLASSMGESYLLLLGVLFILSVLLIPNGIAGLFFTGPQLTDTTPVGGTLPPRPPLAGGDVLAAEAIVKRFAGNTVLDGVDLRIKPREIVCLIGPNGAGKTTLINVLSGAIDCDSGSVTLRGEHIERTPPDRRVAAGLARTFQVPSLFPGLTVAEHLILARQEAGMATPLPEAYARLEREHAGLRVEMLSLSDRRSLEIAMALCSRPDVLLLDEPAAGLARNDAGALAKTLRALRDHAGCAIVCVEHDMEIVRDLADRVVCLHHGRVISEGTMDHVSANAEVRRAYLGLV